MLEHSSFSRSHRDKDRDREKARLLIGVKNSLIRLYVKFGHFGMLTVCLKKCPLKMKICLIV